MNRRLRYTLIGMSIIPVLARLNLSGTGHEGELIRYLVPTLVGGTAGFLIGLMKDGLLVSISKLSNTFNISPSIICVANINTGRFIECNKTVTKLLGVSPKEFISKPIVEFVHPDDRQRTVDEIETLVKGSSTANFENRYLCKDGSYKWLSWNVTEVDINGKVYATASDVSERKQAEQEIQSLARFPNENPSPVLRVSEDGTVLYANDSSRHLLDIWHCDVGKKMPMQWRELCKLSLEGNQSCIEEVCCEGQTFEMLMVPIREESYINLYGRNITKRKLSESKVSMLLQAMENAGECVLITDGNAIIEYVNPAFSEITGYSSEEVVGETASILKSEAQDPSFYKELWETIINGEVWHGTLIDKKKDGSLYPAMMSISPIKNKSGETTHYVSIQQDLTEQRKLEEQLLQAQKMEAIGTLVGGIAHDFNNTLAAIQGNIYLAKQNKGDEDSLAIKLGNIEKLSEGAAVMVQQLLTFARKDMVRTRPFSLTSFMNEELKLFKTILPENIDYSMNICDEELIIHGDATQLQQALINLLNNARHAVQNANQPKISCILDSYDVDADFQYRHPEIKGERVAHLILEDNGCGIPENALEQIFVPFFTTKGVGEGTGLGLAMVYGSIQTHGGIIEVDSREGEGTIFHIFLPLSKDDEKIADIAKESIVRGEGETILLVDDEVSLREAMVEVLTSLGYRVLSAADGEEGLDIFNANPNGIDVIVSDVVMPKMGGAELAQRVHRVNKHVPVIFTTGYDKGWAVNTNGKVDHIRTLFKPYSTEELSLTLRTLIEGK